jgi:hypothetical protein
MVSWYILQSFGIFCAQCIGTYIPIYVCIYRYMYIPFLYVAPRKIWQPLPVAMSIVISGMSLSETIRFEPFLHRIDL